MATVRWGAAGSGKWQRRTLADVWSGALLLALPALLALLALAFALALLPLAAALLLRHGLRGVYSRTGH